MGSVSPSSAPSSPREILTESQSSEECLSTRVSPFRIPKRGAKRRLSFTPCRPTSGEDLPGFVTHEVDLDAPNKKKGAWRRRSRPPFDDEENDEFQCPMCMEWSVWFDFALGKMNMVGGSGEDTYEFMNDSSGYSWPCDACMQQPQAESCSPPSANSSMDAFLGHFSGHVDDVVLSDTVEELKKNHAACTVPVSVIATDREKEQVKGVGSWLRRRSSIPGWQCYPNEDEFLCVSCSRWRPWFQYAKGQLCVIEASYVRHHEAWEQGKMWDCDDCVVRCNLQADAMISQPDEQNMPLAEVQPDAVDSEERIFNLDPIAALADKGPYAHEGEYEVVLSEGDLFWCHSQKTCATILQFSNQCGQPMAAEDIPHGLFFSDIPHCVNSHLFTACNGKSLLGLFSSLTMTDATVIKSRAKKVYPVFGVKSRQVFLKSSQRLLKGDCFGVITGELKEINVLDQLPDGFGQWPTFIAGNPTSRHAYQVIKTHQTTKGGVVWFGLFNQHLGNKFRYLTHSDSPNCQVVVMRVMRRYSGPFYEFVVRPLTSIAPHTRLSIDKTVRFLPLGFFKNQIYSTERLVPTCTLDPAEIG